ncbi:hypothetical protein L228DRAFT_271834 [Xylona heveae TC161]|uniref:Uncharacterized protein n=1 Tax=Xylona heveae (strain CBS 132557 / TC161) TaxID=1328760 RepID=A0A164Z639_XYLHT|nr:hypothetical protein L228DRAFT_271834 [Xylona heveae TC161]KZF18784.1 hypothetical protein L228DRAFT_271834 [Xylona heveae TC161]
MFTLLELQVYNKVSSHLPRALSTAPSSSSTQHSAIFLEHSNTAAVLRTVPSSSNTPTLLHSTPSSSSTQHCYSAQHSAIFLKHSALLQCSTQRHLPQALSTALS